jgi:tetratricopeptide (TPR) repeat protein
LDEPVAARYSMVAGALLVLLLALAVSRSMRGGASEDVLAEARQRLGPSYEYFISSMTTTTGPQGSSVSALVLAYDSSRIRPVAVRCEGAGASLRCASRSRASGNEPATENDDSAEAGASGPGPAAPPEPADPLAQGHESFRKRDFAAAIAAYTTVLERDPASAEGRYWRGVAHARIGERELALQDLDECIARGDQNIDVYIELDRLLMQTREWTRIIDNWTAFIGRNPESGRAYYERGGARQRSGDVEQARRDAEESCRLGYQPGCQVVERFSRRE